MRGNTFIYIAGPYRALGGKHDWSVYYEIDQHINEARMWASKLATEQIAFFCPHLNSAHFEVTAPSATPEFWYTMDMVLLQYASALLLIPGWEHSEGATAENQRAMELGIPVYRYQEFDLLVKHWRE